MLEHLRSAVTLTALLALLTGLVYPLAVTGIAQVAFPSQANGSTISREGIVIGSDLIGQNFSDDSYFWPRPSATSPDPYNAAASSGSNYGPTDARLIARLAEQVAALGGGPVPGDAVTTSGSGLDPHISPDYAAFQVARVAGARDLAPEALTAIVEAMTEQPVLGIFGTPRVNVLRLNLALDEAAAD